jgi:hypothetical protein
MSSISMKKSAVLSILTLSLVAAESSEAAPYGGARPGAPS